LALGNIISITNTYSLRIYSRVWRATDWSLSSSNCLNCICTSTCHNWRRCWWYSFSISTKTNTLVSWIGCWISWTSCYTLDILNWYSYLWKFASLTYALSCCTNCLSTSFTAGSVIALSHWWISCCSATTSKVLSWLS